jgi:DNA polymerase-3 subunit alpha
MEKFLDKSLGVLVYQDDLLYTAIEVAGYDWLEVDKFRKAVGKKIPEEMAKQHEIFVEGCMEHSGMSKSEAEGLWGLFEPFQGYGFNKAHSASYGMVAYQTAYMKAKFPVEYMAALLTAESGDTDKIALAIGECRRMGIKVMPPNINDSAVRFKIIEDRQSLDERAIVFGLSAIKNVGVAAIEAILAAREPGPFVSLADFCNRVDARRVNKKVVESLIKVGALSMFGIRAGLLDSLEEVRSIAKAAQAPQQSLFDTDDSPNLTETISQISSSIEEFSEDELQKFERELLGFTLTGESATDTLTEFGSYITHHADEITEDAKLPEEVKVAGVIKNIRKVVTKNGGKEMAFGTLDDGTGELGLVVFPKIYGVTKEIWESGKPVLVIGKVDHREETPSILVNQVLTLGSLNELGDAVVISIPPRTTTQAISRLKSELKKSPGLQKVVLQFSNNSKTSFPLPFTVEWNEKLAKSVDKLLD